ncbi:MAG: GNAT family N-acetyltransferase [bacterium]|nr:GNAT family N-acetyltransferase [bacterium]
MSDAPDMFAYASEEDVARFFHWEAQRSIAESEAYIREMVADYEQGLWPGWAIEWKADGRVVGVISLRKWYPEHRQTELSYAMNPGYGGKGIMTEAVERVVELCFRDLGLERIEARCLGYNFASEKVMQKVGMTYEGTLRHHQFIKGKFHDFKVYSILRGEWDAAAAPKSSEK